jgi:hypothetical protein
MVPGVSGNDQRHDQQSQCDLCGLAAHRRGQFSTFMYLAGQRAGFALMSAFNSFVVDYATRQKLAGGNMNFFIVNQLPIFPPNSYESACRWSEGSLRAWILPRALELTYTAWDLEPFALDCGWSDPPFRWDDERRFLLRCELDAAFFHLYLPAEANGGWRLAEGEAAADLARLESNFQTPRSAVEYIMDTFPIVRRRDEEKHQGDYLTKRVILEIYDAMQEAIRTGRPYRALLDPPPADPHCSHSAGKTSPAHMMASASPPLAAQ